MKRTFYKLIAIVLLFAIYSCKKEENLEVDLNKFNVDNYVKGPIDNWLLTNLEQPYNIQTSYRFERNLTDVDRDLSPVDLEKVEPMMNAVLQTFLLPYEKVAGKTFIKTYTPKQFVLYGSPSYNSNGSITLGSADAGRTVILYEVNGLDFNNSTDVKRKIRTIHHEFTHILNQNIVIPAAFEQISKAEYTANWTGSVNSAAVAKDLGFISRYSRSSYREDFAEMSAHLLVEGQVFFENYLASSNEEAAAKLREKEKMVYSYFKDHYNIDFKALQNEVQNVLKTVYGATDPIDLGETFPFLLKNAKVNTLVYNPASAHYTTYGSSTEFTAVYDRYKAAIAANGRKLSNFQFLFSTAAKMVFRVVHSNAVTGQISTADYNFNYTINTNNGEVLFTKAIPEGTGVPYTNGQDPTVLPAFESIILPYLTTKIFVASWLPTKITPTDPLYGTFAGFSVKGAPTNYFYGPIFKK